MRMRRLDIGVHFYGRFWRVWHVEWTGYKREDDLREIMA